ncbi:MAG: 1-acyl-sn-glycerol-3-phosphate acyltransferase [Rhodobacteraceae bacterium]|nr:1-acyl-sn-glycerol-3-phosphate acyltransferase [Paracoccaceae bacterium]
MISWGEGEDVKLPLPKGFGWVRFSARVTLVAITIFGLMLPMFAARALRMKAFSEAIVRIACVICLRFFGIPLQIEGKPMEHPGAVVANHASWLDIFTLNAVQRVYFVSKDELQNWPLIGIIARSAGTVFIERRTRAARRQKDIFLERIKQDNKLLFFPEGTSTDGRRVIRFRSTLFAAFFEPGLRETMWIQPVTVNYHAPEGADERFYGFWGDMEFWPHFAMVLANAKQGRVVIRFSDPIRVADVADRKALSERCEVAVRDGLQL